jgi:tight adherence protein C
MPGPQTVLLVLAASGLAMLAGMHRLRRHAALARLDAVLGREAVGGMFGFSDGLHWIGSKVPGGADQSLQSALTRAGYFQPEALAMFAALRLICTGAVFAAIVFTADTIGAKTFLLAVFLAFACSRGFVILLKLKAERRERQLRRELPPFVDILLMVLNSGISIDQSLRYITGMLERTAPLTTAVLKRYVADIDSGLPFEAAFERMGQRLAIHEGYDLAHLIKQSLLQGGEIMTSLESFGAELADKRVAAAREQIGRKSVLLTLAMLAFFMPVLMITLGGPAVSQIMRTLTTAKHELHAREMRR